MAFSDTLRRWMEGVESAANRYKLYKTFEPIFDRYSTQALTTAGLVIHGSAGTVPKTGTAASYYVTNGILQTIAGSVDMPALVGTVVNATYNVYCFFLDVAGTKTSAMGAAGTTLALVKFPPFPIEKALIGFIIVNPTGTGNFVGGTTALDDGTVTPGTLYVSPTGPFDPACLTGV